MCKKIDVKVSEEDLEQIMSKYVLPIQVAIGHRKQERHIHQHDIVTLHVHVCTVISFIDAIRMEMAKLTTTSLPFT